MKKSIILRIAAALISLVMTSLLFGCGEKKGSKDGSLEAVLEKGELVLGLDSDFPPMGFTDENGEIVGFDIDFAKEVCDRLGVKLVPKVMDWDKKYEYLGNKEIDCIWNGLSVTPARSEAMELSDPYMKNELVYVVLADGGIKNISDLEGKKIGVQSGSTASDTLKNSNISKNNEIVSFESIIILLEALESKEIDSAFIDSVPVYYYIYSSDVQFLVLSDDLRGEDYAIGFRKGAVSLRDRIQEIIADMKEDGTLGEISKKWFGSDITTVR